jgi:CelD/BcsL family acetyltransferase involved in cellulose biosynthesis
MPTLLAPPEISKAKTPTISHQILSSVEEIEAQRSDWDHLVDDGYAGNPFLLMDWHVNWLKVFAPEISKICYVRIENEQEILAYFPLVVRKGKFHGIPVRFLGYAGNSYCPVNCPLLRRQAVAWATNHLVSKVMPKLGWDVFFGRDLPEEDVGLFALESVLQQSGYRTNRERWETNLVCENPGPDWETFLRGRKAPLRRNIGTKERRLSARGEVKLRLVGKDTSAADIALYQQVYARSWKQPEHPLFHPRMMEIGARAGWLRLGFLTLNGRPIATQIWLFRGRRGYALRQAYDQEFKDLSPGINLTTHMIRHLLEVEKMNFFDYLKGDEAYKEDWTDTRRQRYVLTTFQKNALGQAMYCLDRKILPWARRQRYLDWAKIKLSNLMNHD